MRTITPLGTLVRNLLSGRVEVFHADGSTAMRNPTIEEMRAKLEKLRNEPAGMGERPLEVLERLIRSQEGEQKLKDPMKAPTEKEKAAGLPGHWIVVRPDGLLFGRVPVPQPPKPDLVKSADADAVDAGSRPGSRASDTVKIPPA